MESLGQDPGPVTGGGWKKRLFALVAVLALGGLLVVGWSLRISSSTWSPSQPVVFDADLPRYETAHRPFTVRFSLKTGEAIPKDIYLYLLSDMPIVPSDTATGMVPLKKGEEV